MLLQPLVSSASTQLAKSLMPSESSTSATDSLVSGAESILDSSKTSQPSTSQQKTTQATASSAKASASVEKPTQAKESSASSSKKLLHLLVSQYQRPNQNRQLRPDQKDQLKIVGCDLVQRQCLIKIIHAR